MFRWVSLHRNTLLGPESDWGTGAVVISLVWSKRLLKAPNTSVFTAYRLTESDCSQLRNMRPSKYSGREWLGLRASVLCSVSTSLCEPVATGRPDVSLSR